MKLNDAIAAACEELGASYENNALWFEILVGQAIRTLKTSTKLITKTEQFETLDRKFGLPNDWFEVEAIYLSGTTQCYTEDIHYCIQGDTVIFNHSVAMPNGTTIDVVYRGLRKDENDNLIIPNDWERLLVSYIGWKFTRKYIKEYGQTVMEDFKREFRAQKLSVI